MKKIMILANSPSGLYDFRNELLVELLKKNEVYVSTPLGARIEELENEGCRIIPTSIDRRGVNPVKDIQLHRFYLKTLREIKPDLVLSYTIKPNVYGGYACQKLGIPYMETVTGLGNAFQKTGLMKKIIVTLYKIGVRGAECLFFQNASNMQIFKDCKIKAKKEKLVMGSGVNLENHIYEEYPDNGKTTILFMSRILKEKGIEEFLATAKALKQENVEFAILGDCEEAYEDIIKEYEKDGYIVWHGYQKIVNPYLKNCSALILPSFYPEGISNVLMEASATGRPILTTNMPGCRDVVDDGVSGFIFEPQNAKSTIEAVKKFLALSYEEKKQMGMAARKKMEREFDRKKVVKDYIDEINKFIQ